MTVPDRKNPSSEKRTRTRIRRYSLKRESDGLIITVSKKKLEKQKINNPDLDAEGHVIGGRR